MCACESASRRTRKGESPSVARGTGETGSPGHSSRGGLQSVPQPETEGIQGVVSRVARHIRVVVANGLQAVGEGKWKLAPRLERPAQDIHQRRIAHAEVGEDGAGV